MRTILERLLSLLDRGEDAVLVTVVLAQGSTPRGAGSQLLAGREGLAAGTIGGGAGEAQALALAEEVLEKRGTAVRRLELRHGGELDSVCGGEQTVLLQFVPRGSQGWKALGREALNRLEDRRGGWLVLAADRDPVLLEEGPGGSAWDGQRLLLPLPKGERVVIFGGGHCTQALVPVLSRVGFRITVMDNRPELSRPELFSEAEHVLCGDYFRIGDFLDLTPSDYVVVMTNGHSHDFDVLRQILQTPPAYVGVIGSRRKTAFVNQKLLECGIEREVISRVHAPIGTAIKAVTPEEIAGMVAGSIRTTDRE